MTPVHLPSPDSYGFRAVSRPRPSQTRGPHAPCFFSFNFTIKGPERRRERNKEAQILRFYFLEVENESKTE